MEVQQGVSYSNTSLGVATKKEKEYKELEAALLTLKPGTAKNKGVDGESLFVAMTELSSSTLSKKIKSLTPTDGSIIFKIRKQYGPDKKVTGTRIWKFFTVPEQPQV